MTERAGQEVCPLLDGLLSNVKHGRASILTL